MKMALKFSVAAAVLLASTMAVGDAIAQNRGTETTFRVVYVSEIGSDSERSQLLSSATPSRIAEAQQALSDDPRLTRDLRGMGIQLRNVIRRDRTWSGSYVIYVR